MLNLLGKKFVKLAVAIGWPGFDSRPMQSFCVLWIVWGRCKARRGQLGEVQNEDRKGRHEAKRKTVKFGNWERQGAYVRTTLVRRTSL
ncbi:hypothetical protein M011DRAFT_219593 [Sporormia fimetaria CBS 119925]|uniref:Uncharacterized protein n=1 Tax=Sporormia fimetaria CBS 119925 TaxID=1340428 RepID=A0A6A6UZ86_9PLEO|nr:hypothetical protein M011DRAFT_219593 [Sporormia fimetaria CBS 119925]